jgi:hypothetical protein
MKVCGRLLRGWQTGASVDGTPMRVDLRVNGGHAKLFTEQSGMAPSLLAHSLPSIRSPYPPLCLFALDELQRMLDHLLKCAPFSITLDV